MSDGLFTVVVIDGELAEYYDPYTQVIRYDGLSRDSATVLIEQSISQGYVAAIWAMPDEDKEADTNG